jgi:hypothetical protein
VDTIVIVKIPVMLIQLMVDVVVLVVLIQEKNLGGK